MRWLARLVILACALTLAGLPHPAPASNPSNLQATGELNATCATSTGCVQATSVSPGSQLCVNMTPPAAIAIQVANSYTGTIVLEGSLDGTNFVTPNGGLPATITTVGTWTASVTNVNVLCARMSALTAGNAQVTISVNNQGATNAINVVSPLDGSGNVAVHEQGTATVQPAGGSMNIAGAGAAGSPAGGVLSVQGVTGMTALHEICDSGCAAGATTGWTYYTIPASALCVSAPCVIKATAATFGGIINESTSAQPAGNCTWYDSASLASGNVLYLETTLGAGQVVTMPYPGMTTTNGIVVQCAANPGGSGIVVLYK